MCRMFHLALGSPSLRHKLNASIVCLGHFAFVQIKVTREEVIHLTMKIIQIFILLQCVMISCHVLAASSGVDGPNGRNNGAIAAVYTKGRISNGDADDAGGSSNGRSTSCKRRLSIGYADDAGGSNGRNNGATTAVSTRRISNGQV